MSVVVAHGAVLGKLSIYQRGRERESERGGGRGRERYI